MTRQQEELAELAARTTARLLRQRWDAASREKNRRGTPEAFANELRAWDRLIEHLDQHDLAGTEADPR